MSSQPYPSAVPASVAVAAGTTAADALAAAGVPLTGPSGAVVVRDLATGALRDLDWSPEADARSSRWRWTRDDGRTVLRHSTAHVHGPGRAGPVPGRQARHRAADRERLLLRLRLPSGRSPPRTSTAIEKRMREIVKAGQRFSRRPVSDDEARAELADEPYKLELIDLKGDADGHRRGASVEVGGGELTMYDNLDRAAASWSGPTCAAARTCRPPGCIPAFKLIRIGRGVLAGQREEPAAAADLRHRLGEPGRAQGRTCSCSPRPSKRDHRRLGAELDLFSFPDEIGSGLAGLPPQGRHHPPGDGGLLRRQHDRGRATSSSTPRTSPRATCSRSPATWTGTRTACSRRWSWRAPTTTSSR